ncbi:glycoside hydrolase family 3 C-terminal domain-containing protein [Fibrella sp. HMF5335]|uniref:beta-glucosidase n=1 Tax=Fibrella rubiginis TaxID=2817060 RepID=A0A939GGM1_9BACT|nr:glycoside hydrolase family 3 protein [Fibrella rubiginis]MBO0938772.1 glycoside hydrolase family 3 C-terminal domain-containing protein [Fibrella rubiginis]
MKTTLLTTLSCLSLLPALAQQKWTETTAGTHRIITNPGGQTLGYSPESGVKLLTVNGLAFKDLNRNGALDPYEDWRLPVGKRAADLARKLSVEEIAGLMLYSSHQSVPARPDGYFAGTYKGKPFVKGETDPSDLTDQQQKFLKEDKLRHVLITSVQTPAIAAQWNNKIQAYCEGVGKGIPANNSSDPRHGTVARAEYNAAAGGRISMWPSSLGMAATFNPALVEQFGRTAAAEYRALGITTALSPQIDMATEPRWGRFEGTFGESPTLAAAMARAYCNGFQTSTGANEVAGGWGFGSVNAMVKHWPGGGAGEAGRDAHYANGKYAVYPGKNFAQHMIPFTTGAFKLNGKTGMASAVMPYYTISWNQDTKNGENVANNYNRYIITDLLRNQYGYDGVVCTDWLVTGDHKAMDVFVDGKSWGVEKLSLAERHYKILMAGIDQFGGNNDKLPVLEAYQIGVKAQGEAAMRARMEQSAVRLLRNIFRVGLFENPYVNPTETTQTVGRADFMKAGYDAQVKSVVMLKNKANVLPLATTKTVYVPKRYVAASRNFLGMETPATTDYPVNMDLLKKYVRVTDNPAEADVALVFIENPKSGIGYDKEDLKTGGNGYVPISLQYGDYTATDARETSLAGGDPMETFINRSYRGKSVKTRNATDVQLVKDTRQQMNGKPVLVVVNVSNPMVFSEFESDVNALLVSFNVQDQAVLDILTGKAEPSALLPMQMPASMSVVEKQAEDVPFDLPCHRDSEGHTYDFGFGMNWKGVINDARVRQYH